VHPLPYRTSSLPGVGGRIKQRPEDFVVEEIPLYAPSGEGTHVYFQVRKRGVPTNAVVNRIARYMGVRPRQIGVAGMKDAHAVTTQMMSLEHADAEKLGAYRDRQVEITGLWRHGNKLRPGHLAGNRFRIRVRDAGEQEGRAAQRILDALAAGVPNYFGRQRFGARGDTGLLGEAMVKDDLERFVSLFLGRPRDDDPPDIRAAREAFDAGQYDRALERWPRHYNDQRRALSAYRKKRRPGAALAAVDRRLRKLCVSAFQSAMFNEVLARRIETIDRLLEGDYAMKTDTGGLFVVEDVEAEQPRADQWEISPAGPVFGYRTSFAGGEPGRIEREVLAAHGVELGDFRRVGPLKVKGTRRPLRFALTDAQVRPGRDERGSFLEVSFTAPSGCYATTVLRELMKDDRPPPGASGVRPGSSR